MPHNDADDWFYIRSCSTGGVITASTSSQDPLLRSQVYVRPPKQVDEELWRWDDRHLVNKATQLVLDIRKGRLRMLEDTEICIYSKKPKEESVNQLWGVREDDTDSNEIICTSPRTPGSFIIYSYYSSDWVLDIQESSSGQQQQQDSSSKLILFPYQPVDNDRQRWMFIPASNGIKPLVIDEKLDVIQHEEEKQGIEPAADAAFAYGLTPAKRKSSQAMSNAPLAAYKEAYQMVQRHVTQLSNKTVAMAAAYQTLFHKNEGSSDAGNAEPVADQDELQATAQSNAVAILEQYEHLQHLHKDVVMALAAKLVISLYEREHRR